MKKNLITKTLFLTMGLCVASGITATLVSTNKSAVAVHAETPKKALSGELPETTTFDQLLPDDFPKDEDKGWVNENGAHMYAQLENDPKQLWVHYGTKEFAPVINWDDLQKDENIYYKETSGIRTEFFLEGNELRSVKISGITGSDDNVKMNGTYTAPMTVADVLPDDFPVVTTDLPDNAWANDANEDIVIGLAQDNLVVFDGPFTANLIEGVSTTVLTKNGNDYSVATSVAQIIFHCKNDIATSIEVTGASMPNFNGTYSEPGAKVGDKFTDNGINYVITSIGGTNTVKVGDNTNFTGTTVNIPANVTYNGVTFDVTEIGEKAFYHMDSLTSVTFANDSKITTIGKEAFAWSRDLVTSIPASVTTIGESAFYYTAITEVTIPAGVTTIENEVFFGCKSLASVTFAENSELTTVGEYAFARTAITEIKLPADVTTISQGAFSESKLEKFEFPIGVTVISKSAFAECPFTEIEIPAGVTIIGDSAFDSCQQLISVTFAENSALTTIDMYAFYQVGITEIEIPASVTTIGEGAFDSCEQLTSVTFAKNSSLTTIGAWPFEFSAITEIEIPASVTNIGEWAFYECGSLTTVKILAKEVPATGENIFGGCDNLETIYVLASSLEAYQTAWADYASKIKALHVHAIKEIHFEVDSTCLESGHKAYYECDCGKYFSDEALTQEIINLDAWLAEDGDGYIAPKGHSFGGKVTYTWNEETHECTASWKCQREGCTETQSELASIQNGKVAYVKDFDATCTANEKGHYEATFTTVQEFEKQVTSMFDVQNTAKGHNYGTPTYTWNEDHTKCTATATCSHGDSTITNEGTVTVEDGYAVATFKDSIFETQRFKLPEPTPSKDGLSGGAIAGIAVGSAVVVGLGAFSLIWFGIKKKSFADLIGIFKK